MKQQIEKAILFWMQKHPGRSRQQSIDDIEARARSGNSDISTWPEFSSLFSGSGTGIEIQFSASDIQNRNDTVLGLIDGKMKCDPEMLYSEALMSVQLECPALFSEPEPDRQQDILDQIENLILRKQGENPAMSYCDALLDVQIESPLPFAYLRSMET